MALRVRAEAEHQKRGEYLSADFADFADLGCGNADVASGVWFFSSHLSPFTYPLTDEGMIIRRFRSFRRFECGNADMLSGVWFFSSHLSPITYPLTDRGEIIRRFRRFRRFECGKADVASGVWLVSSPLSPITYLLTDEGDAWQETMAGKMPALHSKHFVFV